MSAQNNWQTAIELLEPARVGIEIALAADDPGKALLQACQVATDITEMLEADQTRTEGLWPLHAIWVEWSPGRLAALADGTLIESHGRMDFAHQCWNITSSDASMLSRALTQQMPTLSRCA
jgi:hypothetical protein